MTTKDIIQKEIEKLPDNLLSEVFDFIQFLEIKEQRTDIAKASQKLSDASLKKVWDNEEDSIYDSL
ncbi:MAG: DUF2281 domain-containing protein [Deltaproteobacteria bacterium]|nr:DUF2281 domain-containing protein [Deltaproteobacteria bacterium]MCL5278055.1 DUF2281 domain-containing protein [Deltaproteobacteria bacterium]